MRKPLLSVLLSVLTLAAFAATALAQTPDEIVEKHLAALGGREALGKLTSRRATGTVSIETPAGTLSGPVELNYKAPNKSRALMQLDLSALGVADKMTIEQRFDGLAGWSMNSMQGDSQISGNQLENMKNNTFPSALLTYKTAGATVRLLPKEQFEGKDVLVLELVPKSGSTVRITLDAQTYLIVRTAARVSSPEAGEFEQTSTVSDYRTVDGVKVAFQVVNTNPFQSVTLHLEKVEHNVAIDDAMFSVKGAVGVRRPQ